MTLTQSPSPSASPTVTVSPSETPTPIPEPLRVELAIYNSAGELVKLVYQGSAQAATQQLSLLPGLQVGPSGKAALGIDGVLTASGRMQYWEFDNNAGQAVGGGTYYVKMTTTDRFGSQLSYSLAVPVVPVTQGAKLEIFNSAGELVRNLPLDALSGLPTDLRVDGEASFASGAGGLKLDLRVGAGQEAVYWDGLTERGDPAASGTYWVKLTYGLTGEVNSVKTVAVTLLQSPLAAAQAAAASARFAPNPLPAGQAALRLYYTPTALGHGRLRIYNLAGELVATGVDQQAGLIEIAWPFSAGVYVADFGIVGGGGGTLARRALKLAVVR